MIYHTFIDLLFYILYSTTLQFGKKNTIISTRTIFPVQRYQRWAKSRQTEDSLTGWVPGKRSSVPCYATQKEALKAYLQVMRRNKEEREQAEKRKEQHRTQNEEGVWVPFKLEDLFMWLSFFGKNVLLRLWSMKDERGSSPQIVAPPNFWVVANSLWNRKQHLEQLLLDLRTRTLSSPQRRQATWHGDGRGRVRLLRRAGSG